MQFDLNSSFNTHHYHDKPNKQRTIGARLRQLLEWPMVVSGYSHLSPYLGFCKKVNQRASELENISDEALQQAVQVLKRQMFGQFTNEHLRMEAFALVKLACKKVLDIQPYETQLLAASIMLDGNLAEMATGEGKTFTAGIAAAVAAFHGIPVHVITANDYLVNRDAKKLQPLYEFLGLKVGAVNEGMAEESRRVAYQAHITYCTAKELVFDFLRDQSQMQAIRSELHLHAAKAAGNSPNIVLRGLGIAIIDEADTILVDEASVPLILSKSGNQSQQHFFNHLFQIAKLLKQEIHFYIHHHNRSIELTQVGLTYIQQQMTQASGLWANQMYWKEMMQMALAAIHLYQRDVDYLIEKQFVKIIDPLTGRVAEGRIWSKGLHQMIELKEGLAISADVETIAQITYQRFFPKYMRVGGMSGTLYEARSELHAIYHLRLLQVPLHQPSQRQGYPSRLFKTQTDMLSYVLNQVQSIHQQGRPILIGTDSVEASEQLSLQLKTLNLTHQVLNAKQNAIEAHVISQAGQQAKITISTNMAGRGTDIHIPPEVTKLGGLHVISCQHNDSKRIDRQLIGRAARQGDPGSAQLLMCLEGLKFYQRKQRYLSKLIPSSGVHQPQWLVSFIMHLPKWFAEYQARSQRISMYQQDILLSKENLSV